jgi:DNA-binding NtrC family response regulator
MPRVTGPEVIAEVHRHRPGLPALLMSGLSSPDDASAQASGYSIVAKPLEIGPLSHVVRDALAAARAT